MIYEIMVVFYKSPIYPNFYKSCALSRNYSDTTGNTDI